MNPVLKRLCKEREALLSTEVFTDDEYDAREEALNDNASRVTKVIYAQYERDVLQRRASLHEYAEKGRKA